MTFKNQFKCEPYHNQVMVFVWPLLKETSYYPCDDKLAEKLFNEHSIGTWRRKR